MSRPRFPITPLFWVEVDPSRSILPVGPFIEWHDLNEVVGLAAKELHCLSRHGVNTSFVFKTRDEHYTLYSFDFTMPSGYKLIATLTVLKDNRVQVDYNIDKPTGILYL